MAAFSTIFADVTKLGTKLQTSEYLENGKHPIVDQGQDIIAGYTNQEEGLFSDVPVIVFGDHTRVVKYIDTPFFLGADGVKVLKGIRPDTDTRYLYYAVSAVRIPNTGYNRHFKWLKEADLPLPDLPTQRRIAATLDKVSEGIDLCRKMLGDLDALVKSQFVEMFGDLVRGDKIMDNKHTIGDIASVTKLAGFEFTKYITYQESGDIIMLRGLNCKRGKLLLDDIKWIDKKTSDLLPRSKLNKGDILMTYAGTIGDVALVDEDDKYHLAPNVGKITLTDPSQYDPVFMIYLFIYTNDYIMTFASQSSQASISMEKIRKFEYHFPDYEQQKRFALYVNQTDKSKSAIQQQLLGLETLKKSLMQKYFR